MPDIFVSYKRDDEHRVGRLVHSLRKAGLSVWWDRDVVSGETWREQIHHALQSAGCVLVVWTVGSVGPAGEFVRDEAAQAKRRNVLLPLFLDRVDPPLGFGEIQALDLIGWAGSLRDPRFVDLLEAVRAKLAGRAVPPAQAPMKRLVRRLVYGSLSSAAVVVAAVLGANLFGVQERLCSAPHLADACGALNLGNQPTREERMAWAARERGSCAALRSHIERFDQGIYRRQAAEQLAARRVSTNAVWAASTRSLPMLQLQDERFHANEAAARSAALRLAKPKAEQHCKSFATTVRFRLKEASARAQTWDCNRFASGVTCGFEGEAICILEERADVESETCGP